MSPQQYHQPFTPQKRSLHPAIIVIAILIGFPVVCLASSLVASIILITLQMLSTLPSWGLFGFLLLCAASVGGIVSGIWYYRHPLQTSIKRLIERWKAAKSARQLAEYQRQMALDQAQRVAVARQAYQVEQARKAAQEAERRWLAQLSTLHGLRSLSPRDFELTVGNILSRSGYTDVVHTGGAGDLSVDLKCKDASGSLISVQCKRYAEANRVGSKEIQQFIGMIMVHHHADGGLYITTSSYTKAALNLANQHRNFLVLIDGDQLVTMIQRLLRRP